MNNDTVKNAVASAVFQTLTNAASAKTLVSWPVEIQRVENLEALIIVKPVEGQPRRVFTVRVKEQL